MSHHILLISIDALRADRLGCYGNPRPLSPNIDRLADESILFFRATSPSTWTLPSHMSMLSGLEPPVHGCVSAVHAYPPEMLPFPLLFELMSAAGYDSSIVAGGGYVDSTFGFSKGVADFQINTRCRDAFSLIFEKMSLQEATLGFVHTYEVHDYSRWPGRPTSKALWHARDPDYDGFFPTDRDFNSLMVELAKNPDAPRLKRRDIDYLADLYDGAVQNLDLSLGGLFQDLIQNNLWEDTTLIITSDHGESLGEEHRGHQYILHGGPPYQEQIHVPLIIRPAKHLRSHLAPRRIDEPVSLVDITPTILSLADISYSTEEFQGISLLDLCLGRERDVRERRLFFHSCEDLDDKEMDPRFWGTGMTWSNGGKVISDHRTGSLRECYNLGQDPGETENIIHRLGKKELDQIYEAFSTYWEEMASLAFHPASVPIEDPTVIKRLEALGYLK